MLKKLMLCHNINKFYKIFGDLSSFGNTVIYKLSRVHIRDLSDELLMSVGFDIAEVLEVCDDFTDDQMSRWLNKLYKEVMI